MTNVGTVARVSLSASILIFALGMNAQSNPPGGVPPPNVPPSGAASQNSAPATPGSAGTGSSMGHMDADDMHSSATSQKEMDKQFVRKMIMGNHAEIDAGNLAVQKASSDDVKKFGQKMVDDHTMLLNDLNKVAENLHIKAPQAASAKDKAMAAKLSAMSGDAFDRAYVKDMVKDHEKDVAEVKKETNSASIPEVKDAATKALPVIQSHLEMIQGIQKNMMSGSASTK